MVRVGAGQGYNFFNNISIKNESDKNVMVFIVEEEDD